MMVVFCVGLNAQEYEVPVSEVHEPMQKGCTNRHVGLAVPGMELHEYRRQAGSAGRMGRSLAKGNPYWRKTITKVYLLGYGSLKAQQTAEGLIIHLPEPCNKIAPVFRITK